MRRFETSPVFALVALVGLLSIAVAVRAADAPQSDKPAALKNPVAATPQSIAAGQATFAKYCRFCHGADAKGDGPQAPKDSHPPNLTDEKWERGSSDGEIFAVIRDGTPPDMVMKPYKGKMTDQDMWNIVNYLRSLGPKPR